MALSSKMSEKNVFVYEQESQSDRLARKSKETPVFPIAIAGCVAAVAYGAYKFKSRGQMSPSVFLMQLRVGAQGIAVGTLTIGLAYTMIQNILHDSKSEQ
ncbi:HIG1 domain family member 1A, mitochondrial isoform X2 [Agrilus planipennis]|uniref:HIG1 domain family member 1A, mitochondrial isoform X2 n=1 Tax=Agrilus planipennis TaxID=224129 RepID=A0A1W4WU50_AGRPL|nr:HIG1 domain family member 1A, mitochondrial isoform X2 [Agrilus planipennis]